MTRKNRVETTSNSLNPKSTAPETEEAAGGR